MDFSNITLVAAIALAYKCNIVVIAPAPLVLVPGRASNLATVTLRVQSHTSNYSSLIALFLAEI